MSDLGAALVTLAGAVVGGAIATWSAWQQSKAQERIAKAQMDLEREQSAERREREVLLDLSIAITHADDRLSALTWDNEVQRLAYQVDDRVLHHLAETPSHYQLSLQRRTGYLLRTPDKSRRTDDGHEQAAT